jgi:catechol 2,3-dioxygenase-like lactoylglutathione lyase family enzyme
MRLEHVNLVTEDIDVTISFLKIAFPHWKIRGQGKGEWYGKPRTWVHFGEDDTYLAISDHGKAPNRDLTGDSMGLAHIGFVVDDLDGLIARYAAHGYQPSEERLITEHRKSAYYIDGAGFEYEFNQYMSDIPAQRHVYPD